MKRKFRWRLKRKLKFLFFILFNIGCLISTIFFSYRFGLPNGLLLVPIFIFLWMLFMIYIAEKFGYMRMIRTPEEIKFQQEHEFLYRYSSYRDDITSVYRNKLTGKIIER